MPPYIGYPILAFLALAWVFNVAVLVGRIMDYGKSPTKHRSGQPPRHPFLDNRDNNAK